MDNFMDRLSNRFHAGELIRANSEAEAKQMQTLKAQNEELADVISQVRRLNLKTIEVSEQMSQLAAASIEKIEEIQAAANTQQDESAKSSGTDIDGGSGWELEIYQGLSQLHTELQNVENLESSLLAFQETQSEQNSKLVNMMQESVDAQNRPSSWQTEVWQSMSLMQQQLQNVEQLAGSQAALLEQFQMAQSSFQEQMRSSQDEFEKRQEDNNLKIMTSLSEGKDNDKKPGFVYEIEASLSEIENNAARGRSDLNAKLDSIFESIRNKDTDDLQSRIASVISENNKQTDATLTQIKELVVGLRVYMDEVEKKCEDFVHKEDVKVYRNVQANVMETVSARARDIGDKLDAMDKRTDKQKGLKPLIVITMLISLASLALSIVQMLGII